MYDLEGHTFCHSKRLPRYRILKKFISDLLCTGEGQFCVCVCVVQS